MMRAATLWQPWASCIASTDPDAKRIENRQRNITYRGEIAIHAGRRYDPDALRGPLGRLIVDLIDHLDDLPHGAILAVANLVDSHYGIDCCAPWGEPSAWHLVLADVVVLPEPVPCRGRQAVPWYVPDDVEQAVRAQLVGVTA